MSAENALLKMETGSTPLGIVLMTDLGDHQTYGLTGVDVLSYCPPTNVRANGVLAGVNMGTSAVSVANDKVDVAAIVASIKGLKVSVAPAVDVAIIRPATAKAKICSVTVDSTGAIIAVSGLDSLTTAFSLVRAAAGGPPLIPVDSIELFQVRVIDSVPAPITAAQIVHTTEFAETFSIDETGRGDHSADALDRRAHVRFGRALPLIHTGPATRRVYIEASEPEFAEVSASVDFKAAEVSVSSSSTQYYSTVSASSSKSLGTAGFKCKLADGVSDMILSARGKVRTFLFYSDKDQTAAIVTQGMVAAARTFPVAGDTTADVVIAAPRASAEYFID